MPPVSTAKAATPQTTPAVKAGAVNGAATPSARPPPTAGPGAQTAAAPPAATPKKGFAATPAQGAGKKPAATPASAPAANGGGAYPASMNNYGYGTNSGYGGSFMQQQPGQYAAGSMYGAQPNNGSMYPGVGMSSMYGTQSGGYNMYNSAYGNQMAGPAGGGSMYGMGSMGSMGSIGGGYGMGSYFGGSLYGGTMYGMAGSLYGTGGSLYGGNDPQSVMGSMYGSRNGSVYGGFGSFYAVGGPHTNLGTVRKYSMPGFSYTFGSNLGTNPYQRGSSFSSARSDSRRANSFHNTSTALKAEERPTSGAAAAAGGGASAAGAKTARTAEKPKHTVQETEREKEKEAKEAREKNGTADGAESSNKPARQRGISGVDKDGDDVAEDANKANKPESIMKKRASLEAPKSPPRARVARAGAAPVPMLSADFRIHNVAIIEHAGGAAAVTKKGDACVLDGKSYVMDEVLEYTPGSTDATQLKSRYVQDIIEHVLNGHNAALLVSDDGKATAASLAMLEASMTALLEEMRKPSRNSYYGVSATMCGLHSNNMVRDLLVDGARPKALEVGNSPLFGPAVMHLTDEAIQSPEDFNKVYEAALKRGEKETLMVCMLTIKQVHPASADSKEEDVFVSSLLIGVSRGGPKEYHDVMDRVTATSHDIFRYAIDGPSICAHLVAVQQSLADPQVLADCARIGEVQNIAPRSGNARRFIEFTDEQVKRMRERSEQATGADKRDLVHHVDRLSGILADMQKLVDDPQNTTLKLYTMEPDAAPAAEATEKTTKAEASPSTARNAPTPRDGARKVTPTTTANGASPAKDEEADKPMPAVVRSREVPAAATAAVRDAGATASPEEKPRSTNVATVAVVDATDARAFSVAGDVITAGGRPFNVDEVLQRSDLKDGRFASKATNNVLEAFFKGYNGAVVASDSAAVAANGMASPTLAVVTDAVTGALALPNSKGVRVSIALVRDSGKAADLTTTGGAVAEDSLEPSSSPLFGPLVHNAALHRVQSVEDLERLVERARGNLATVAWDAHSVVHVTVLHCFADKDDVVVASLTVTLAPNNNQSYGEVLLHHRTSDYTDLYRYAFGGAATTAFVVFLCGEDEVADATNALSMQNLAGAVRNRSPRQGSVRNFTSYTALSLEKRNKQLATVEDGTKEKEALKKVVGPMERMLADHSKVLEDPDNNFPRAYAADNHKTAKEATPQSATAATTTAAGAKKEEKAATPSTTKAATPSTKAARSAASPADEASGDNAQHEDPAEAGFTEPRVIVFVDRAVSADDKKLSLGEKDYAVDEVLSRGEGSTRNSRAVAEVEARFGSVHNCALMSASSVATRSTRDEPVWAIFEQCLRSAMAAGRPGEVVHVELTFTVVGQDELLDDLMAEQPMTAPRPLEVLLSPIYGPRVGHITLPMVQNAEELTQVMGKMHERADAHLDAIRQTEALMVGTALLRRQTKEGDIEVAALMGMLSGASAKAYRETLEKDMVLRRTLLNCAFGGPSATVTILNIGAEDESAQSMVSTAIALSKKQRNLVSRSGSVLAFVKYSENAMRREQNRAAAAAPEMRERHLQKAERVRPVVDDHKRLLADFGALIPAYPATRSGKMERDRATSASSTSPAANAAARSPGSKTATTTEAAAAAPAAAAKSSPSPATARSPGTGRNAKESPAAVSPAAVAQPPSTHATPAEKPKPATPAEKPKSKAASNPIHTVYVVTPARAPIEAETAAGVTRADDTHINVLINDEVRAWECDEAVSRPDATSTVRADMLSTAVQQFVAGFNTALLCCDLGGSNVGPAACLRVVHRAVETKPENSEMFVAVHIVKDKAVRSTIAPVDDAYRPLQVANSPIFGPWVYGTEVKPLTDLGEVDRAVSSACSLAVRDGAMVVVNLVQKLVVETNGRRDVLLSGLLVALANNTVLYEALANSAPKSKRGLFQYAVQGSCFTVGVLGLTEKVAADELSSSLATFEKLHSMQNRPLRNGSVRNFLSYSVTAVADVRNKMNAINDEVQVAVYKQRLAGLEDMLNDARELLESPYGRPLKVFV